MELFAALIALGGVLLSSILSMYVSKQNLQTEVQRLQKDMQKSYLGKILEKRIEVYPNLYKEISSIAKRHKSGKVDVVFLQEALEKINEWDSSNALFLSAAASRSCYHFRQTLHQMSKKSDESIQKTLKDHNSRFWENLRKLELHLKGDLGVFVVEFSPDKARFDNYKEAGKAVKVKQADTTSKTAHKNG